MTNMSRRRERVGKSFSLSKRSMVAFFGGNDNPVNYLLLKEGGNIMFDVCFCFEGTTNC